MSKAKVAAGVVAALAVAACQVSNKTRKAEPPTKPRADKKPEPRAVAKVEPKKKAKMKPIGKDVTAEARTMNSDKYAEPPRKFRKVHVSSRKLSRGAIKKTSTGFVVQLPSRAPVVTPAVYKDKVYVSGGFRSKQFYSFHATTGNLHWAVNLGDDGPSAPACEDGVCVFNTESCTIFALDAETGRKLWSWWLGDPQLSSPAISKGRVFTSYPTSRRYYPPGQMTPSPNPSSSGRRRSRGRSTTLKPVHPRASHVIAAFELHTGKLIWQRWIDGDVMSAPIATGNELYVTTFSGTVYEFDQATGKILSAIQSRATSAPVVVGDALFYTQRTDGKGATKVEEGMVKQKRKRVAPKKRFKKKGKGRPMSLLDGGFLPAHRRHRFRFAGMDFFTTGQPLFAGSGPGSRLPSAAAKETPAGEAYLAGGGPYVRYKKQAPYLDRKVQKRTRYWKGGASLDAENALGSMHLHKAKAFMAARLIGQGSVSRLQAFQGSRVLYFKARNFNAMGDEIVCTHPKTGMKLWSTKIPGKIRSVGGFMATPPAAAGNYLFVGALKGEVLMLEPKTGQRKRTFKVGAPVRSQPVIHNGWIYVGTQNGQLVAINTRNRRLTGWAQWGGDAARSGIR